MSIVISTMEKEIKEFIGGLTVKKDKYRRLAEEAMETSAWIHYDTVADLLDDIIHDLEIIIK